jgi:hypothetical protein
VATAARRAGDHLGRAGDVERLDAGEPDEHAARRSGLHWQK